ncbi:MAG: sugar phosphate isomerase/epimerase [Oscillospiraceae bacterium]|nr:sugar phosphate isomerase/epimerase [Oscillospiraceae bacterium]
MDLQWGISTACMYPQPMEKTLKSFVQAGIDCTELFVNTFSEFSPASARRYQKILRNGGTKVVSVHPFTSAIEGLLLFSEYPGRFREGLELYKRYFDFAAHMGAGVVVLHGCIQPPGVPEERYWERYDRLHRQAISQGVRLAQENVVRYMSGSLDMLRRMRENIPDVCFVLDIKQAVRSGYDPFQVLEAMGERIVHVHISDHSPEADCLLPGKGGFDFEKLVQKLEVIHHDLSLVLELYRSDFLDFQDLVNSYQFLKESGKNL